MNVIQLTKDLFKDASTFYVIKFGQFFDPMYGFDSIEITEEQIEELKKGNVLYADNDEYATIIRLAERKEE